MPEWIVDLFARYGYAVVFGGVFLENAGLPVPGETALIAGAALAHYGRLSLPRVIATATVAAILGDNLGFLIGRRIGRAVAERHGWRVGLTPARLVLFDRFFDRYGAGKRFVMKGLKISLKEDMRRGDYPPAYKLAFHAMLLERGQWRLLPQVFKANLRSIFRR